MKDYKKFDVLVVGAGISGSTLAERFASIGKKVLIIDKRNHIAGNCYDYTDKNGILVPLYGPHFLHTDYEDVKNYLDKFTEWIPFKLKLLSNVDGKRLVPLPVNINTVNSLFDIQIKNEEEMLKWLEMNRVNIPSPVNSEESAVSRMGRKLYNLLVKNYVKKQWDLWPNELDPEVLDRIPVRTNFDDNYFSDKYQCMPKEGFTKMFQNILSNKNISVKLNTNFFDLKNRNFKIIIFTGKIDDYFNKSNLDKLQYRSMEFHFESINKEFFQDVAVVSYPNTEMFTRITEPKHSTLKKTTKTTIIKEFPTWGEEPYYPIFSKINKDLYSLYKALAEKEKNIYFIGRLAQYKYFDMDDAFKNALDFFDKIKDKI